MPQVLRFETSYQSRAWLPAGLALRPGYCLEYLVRHVNSLIGPKPSLELAAVPYVNGGVYAQARDHHGLGLNYGLGAWEARGEWWPKVIALPESGVLDGVAVGLKFLQPTAFHYGLELAKVQLTDRGNNVLWLWTEGMSAPINFGSATDPVKVKTVEDTLAPSCFGQGSNFDLVGDLELDRAIAGNVRGRVYHDRVRKTWRVVVPGLDQKAQDRSEAFYVAHLDEPFLFVYDDRIPARRVVYAKEPTYREMEGDELLFTVDLLLAEV